MGEDTLDGNMKRRAAFRLRCLERSAFQRGPKPNDVSCHCLKISLYTTTLISISVYDNKHRSKTSKHLFVRGPHKNYKKRHNVLETLPTRVTKVQSAEILEQIWIVASSKHR